MNTAKLEWRDILNIKIYECTVKLAVNMSYLSWQQSVEPSAPSKPSLLSGCLWHKRPKTGPVEDSVLPPVDMQNCCSMSHASCGRTELDLEQERAEEKAEGNNQLEQPPVKMGCEVKGLTNGRTHTSLRPVSQSYTNSSRFRSMHAREKKATQMLAIVLGEWSLSCKSHGNTLFMLF